MVLCAGRTGCSQQKLRGCRAAGHRCQPRLPSPPVTLLVSEDCVSEEGIHIHADLPPPRPLPPAGPKAGNQDTDASPLLARGTPLLPAPRSISRLRRSPKALLHPPWTRQGWKERGQAACPVTPAQPPRRSYPPGLFLKIFFLKSTQTSPLPQYPAPRCPGALFIPRDHGPLPPLPTMCPRATRPPQMYVQHHAQKSTPPKNAAESDTVGSAGQAVGTWTACGQSTSCGENWPRAEIWWL